MPRARFYIKIAKDIIDDPKLDGLTDAEKGAWDRLIILADNYSSDGTLPWDYNELAYRSRMSVESIQGCIEKLLAIPKRAPIIKMDDEHIRLVSFHLHQVRPKFQSDENDYRKGRTPTTPTSPITPNDSTEKTECVGDTYHPIALHPIASQKIVETCKVVGGVGDFSQSKPLAASPPTTKPISRKTRIPEGFQPSEADIAKAMQDHGCSRRDLDSETAAFMEFFLPGGEGETTVHRYWSSAWFRWMRTTRWSSRSKPSSNGAAPANEERMVLDSRIAELSDKIHIGEMKCSHLEPDNLMHTKLAALVAERDTLADRRAAL